MKRSIYYKCVMTSLVFTQVTSALAAAAVGTTPTTPMQQPRVAGIQTGIVGGLGSVVTVQPGQFDIHQADITNLLTGLMDKADIRQKTDREYLISSVNSIQSEYEKLLELVTTGDLVKMSQKSTMNGKINAEDFFKAINDVNEQINLTRTRMNALASVNQQTLLTAATVNDGKNTQTLPNFGQVNFKPILDMFTANIEALKQTANNFPMVVQFPGSGVPEIIKSGSGSTLNPTFTNQPLLSGEQIKDFQKQAALLRSNQPILSSINNHGMQVRSLIQNFITIYGTERRYANRNDAVEIQEQGKGNKTVLAGTQIEDYYKRRDKDFKDIVDAFWERSYLRLSYGVQIGAVQTRNYLPQMLNMEKFTLETETLRGLRQELAMDNSDLIVAAKNAMNILKVTDARSAEIFGDKSANSILMKLNSFMTFVGGRRASAEAIWMIMQLVAADIKEEQLVQTGKLEDLHDLYVVRYQANDASKKYYTGIKCAIDEDLQDDDTCVELAKSNPYSAGVFGGGSGQSIRNQFIALSNDLKEMTAKMDQANNIMRQVRAAMSSQKAFQATLNRRKGL